MTLQAFLYLTTAAAGLQGAPDQTVPIPPRPFIVTPSYPSEADRIAQEEEEERAMMDLARREGMFGVLTVGMSQDEKAVLCGVIAEASSSNAAGATDAATRRERVGEVWRLEQRLQSLLTGAEARLGERGMDNARRKAGEAMALLSMAPDPSLQDVADSGADLMNAFFDNLAGRCHAMLDAMGVPAVSGEPPADYVERQSQFRFRGADAEAVFAGTGLASVAMRMCRDEAPPDFTDLPIDARGKEGMSLLDWAMECDDLAAFDALIAVGADLRSDGLWEDPPLVLAATEKRLAYLQRLLDAGVPPDAMEHRQTALRTAGSDLDAINAGRNTRPAFDLLRARGASLNFPDFDNSMWLEWGLHESRWDLILSHWSEFDSDPVLLAELLEMYLEGDLAWAKEEHRSAALEVKARLENEHGVCFPIGRNRMAAKDDRGHVVQPDCPRN